MKFKRKELLTTRSSKDRRQRLEDRRGTLDIEYIGPERRIHRDRRHGWEERSDWRRITKWISAPKSTDAS